MRAIARSGLLALVSVATAVAVAREAGAQAPPAARPAAGTPAPARPQVPAAPAAARPANLGQVLATANGEPITRGELVNFVSRYQIPPGEEATAYRDAVDSLVNTHLINQYLARQRVVASDAKVTQAIDTLKQQLAKDGTDLATEILRSGMSMDDVRKEYANRIRWIEFLDARATDAELKKYAAAHKDLFNGTQVKASHILLKVDPNATPSDKEKIRQKLLAIKAQIVAGKMTFADAANAYSDDPANKDEVGKGTAGGDVGYFGLNSGFIEEFADAAFALKKGQISDPVETPYGWHLIQVTDRKEGGQFDFEQNKPFVKQMYAAELQKQLLTALRKDAKIEVKPMPADLFPPTAVAPAPAPAQATGGAAAKTAAPK